MAIGEFGSQRIIQHTFFAHFSLTFQTVAQLKDPTYTGYGMSPRCNIVKERNSLRRLPPQFHATHPVLRITLIFLAIFVTSPPKSHPRMARIIEKLLGCCRKIHVNFMMGTAVCDTPTLACGSITESCWRLRLTKVKWRLALAGVPICTSKTQWYQWNNKWLLGRNDRSSIGTPVQWQPRFKFRTVGLREFG